MGRRVPHVPPPQTAGDVQLAVIQQALKRKAGQGAVDPVTFREFIPGAWKVCEGRRRFKPNWHLDAIADVLEAVARGQLRKVVINEPPGMAKSLVTSVMFPAWVWGPRDRPETRFLCLSYGGDEASPANRDAERCRDLITSEWYQQLWGTVFHLSETQNAKAYFANDQRGYRISTGLDGSASGQRADIVLIDDPTKLDDEGVELRAILHPAEVYERTLVHRAIDEDSAFVLIMQRLHPDDLSGYFLKQDGWEHLCLPAFYESERKSRVMVGTQLIAEDPRIEDGEPLHKGMPEAVAIAKRQARMRPDIYDGQQQQRPVAAGGQIVKRLLRYDAWPQVFDEVITTVDCAFKDGEANSFVVFQKWGRRFANAYLLAQVRKHMELPDTLIELQAFCAVEPYATAKYVESKANGVGVVQMLRNRIPGIIGTDDDEEVMKPFCAGSKEAKLQAVAPYFLAGNVLIPSAEWLLQHGYVEDWTVEYVHELTHFPKSRFNDQVDATAMGVWRLLHTFEAHFEATELFDPKGNVGLISGVFDTAYAEAGPAHEGDAIEGRLPGFAWGGGPSLLGGVY
jgi:predicted phage terminase large subunit-like protein